MRILVAGKNRSSKSFSDFFQKDKENIVFSSENNLENLVDLENYDDVADFCEANEINLVLITDKNYINDELFDKLINKNISVFSPSEEAANITKSKIFAKRFMYKNKIPTPKFLVAEKPQAALEYFQTANTPMAIKPDESSWSECTKFCETTSQAQKLIFDFFSKDNKKLLLEDYIEGKNVVIWALSDGYSAKIIGSCAKYQNEVCEFEPDFLDDNLKENINCDIILPTIQALSSQNCEYIGIIGFNIIITFDKRYYLLSYYNFFKDLDVDFFTKESDINWSDVFESTIVGDVFQKHVFEKNSKKMLSIVQNNEINFICAETKTNLKRYLKEMDFDLVQYYEAEKIWKYWA